MRILENYWSLIEVEGYKGDIYVARGKVVEKVCRGRHSASSFLRFGRVPVGVQKGRVLHVIPATKG